MYVDQRWTGDHGIGRFARNVLPGLTARPIELSGHPAAAFDSYRLSRALSSLHSDDLFFSPGYNPPLTCPAPFVFTIHDLSHVYCEQNSTPLIRLYYATIMKRACRLAAKILTVSEFTRSQVLEWSGVSTERVQNVGCGVDSRYRPDGPSYDLPLPYLLSVSNRKPHKNEFRIVEGFAKSGVAQGIHLVFTGNTSTSLAQCIERNQVVGAVHFTGHVSEELLPSLYRGARALIFPSLYEGFGLPLLESMACGTPIVTSNVTAMPEIASGAGLLVDPASVDQIAHAIAEITHDVCLRDHLRAKGLLRAKEYSWSRTVSKVRQILMQEMANLTSKDQLAESGTR